MITHSRTLSYPRRGPQFHPMAPTLTHPVQDGKPSILSLVAGTALPDERSQGITVVVKAEFASLDDMNYFDNDCPVNTAFKDWAKTLKHETKPISVYFEPTVVLG